MYNIKEEVLAAVTNYPSASLRWASLSLVEDPQFVKRLVKLIEANNDEGSKQRLCKANPAIMSQALMFMRHHPRPEEVEAFSFLDPKMKRTLRAASKNGVFFNKLKNGKGPCPRPDESKRCHIM